jgi:hypothetical protein
MIQASPLILREIGEGWSEVSERLTFSSIEKMPIAALVVRSAG